MCACHFFIRSVSPHSNGAHCPEGIRHLTYVVERILDQVLPGWKGEVAGRSKGWEGLRDQAARARAALQREEELAARLGDGAPTMDAGALHPWAWENGASYWRTGHFHQSVMQASVRINAETQP